MFCVFKGHCTHLTVLVLSGKKSISQKSWQQRKKQRTRDSSLTTFLCLFQDLAHDQTIFSSQKKTISDKEKTIAALKAENRLMARMSMSPAVGRGEDGSPHSHSGSPTDMGNDARKDSPTQLGEFRRRLDSVSALLYA